MKTHTRRHSVVPPEIVAIMQSEIPEDFSIVVQPGRKSICESHGSNVDSEDALLSHHDTSGTSGETCRFQNNDGDVKIVKGIPVKKRWQTCKTVCWTLLILSLLAAALGFVFVAYKLYAPLQVLWRNETISTTVMPRDHAYNVRTSLRSTFKPLENERVPEWPKVASRIPRRNYSEPISPEEEQAYALRTRTLPQTTESITTVLIPEKSTKTTFFEKLMPTEPASENTVATEVIRHNVPVIENPPTSPQPITPPPKTYGSKAFIEAPGQSFVNSPLGANYMLATIGEVGTQLTSVEVSYKYFNADKTSPLDYLADVTDAVNRSSAFQMKNMLIAHNTTIASPPQKYKNTTLHFVEPVSFDLLQSEIQSEYGFLSNGHVLTQEMFPIADSAIALNMVEFEMEFKQEFAGLWNEKPNFRGLYGDRDVNKIIGILKGTKMYTDNYDIFTLPMARDSYHFFVMMMREDITEETIPTSDNYVALLNSAINVGLEEFPIAMPVFEHKTLTNYTQWAQKYQLTASIPLGNENRENSKYLRIAAAYQATRFNLNHKGVNVETPKMIVEETNNIEIDLIDVNRPFYYGIFYKNGADQAIIYFGAYF